MDAWMLVLFLEDVAEWCFEGMEAGSMEET